MAQLAALPRLVNAFRLLSSHPELFVFRVIVLLPIFFATTSLLIPQQANAQTFCEIVPSSFQFPATGGEQYACDMSSGEQCFPVFSYSNPPNRQFFSVQDDNLPQCVPWQGLQIDAGINSSCGTVENTFVAGNHDHTVVTMVQTGIGTPSCNVSSSVLSGLGSAGTSTNPQDTGGEPISTGNGNYYYRHTDLSVVDHEAGLPLVFQRTYNSLDNYSGPLGNNWTHNFNITVATIFDSHYNVAGAVVKWGDGHGETFTVSGSIFVPAPGVTNSLARDPNTGAYTLTRKDGVQYLFTWDGLLQSIENTNGLNINAYRDSNFNLTQLASFPQELYFSYDQNNRLSYVTDLSGRTVSYSYDVNNNLISETDPLGNVTTYAYDSGNRLTSITLPNKSVLVQNTYDSSSRVISQTNANGFTTTLAYNTPAQAQTTITDPLGNKTIHTYDSSTRITAITDPLGQTTSYTYDANNNVASITDARGDTSNSTYDSFGNLLTYTDPLGNKASFTYNSFSEPLTIKTPKGNTTTLTYDANGNLITIQDPLGNKTVLAYGTYDLLISVTDARNNTTSLSYNGCTFCLTAITDPLGNQTAFAYDTIGRPTSVTDPNGHTTSVAYDALSHITSVTDPLSNQTLFAYDTVSNLTAITDASGHATTYSYDHVGNLTQVTDALGHKTFYGYDKNNNRIEFVNAKRKATKYTYNAVNRLTKTADPLQDTTSFVYDPVGNVTSETDANGKQSKFSYDKDNRIEKIAYADGSTVKYTYDPDSNRSTMVDTHGKTSYSYDALDRILSVGFPGVSTVAYAYDPVGNRISLKYPDSRSVTYTYDADNRASQVTDWLSQITGYSFDPASNPVGIAYPNKVTSGFSYDAAERLTGIIDSSNGSAFRTLSYALDKVGNRTVVTDNGIATNYTYNPLNELLSSATGSAKTSWTYDAAANRTKQTTPQGVVTEYTYDAADRMLTAGSTTFTYDKNGNQLTETNSSGTTTNSYDSVNRLISSLAPTGTSAFTYDGDGNRITQTIPTGTYNYVNDLAVALPVVLNEKGPDGAIDYAYSLGLTESFSSAFNYFYNLDGLGSVYNLTDSTGTLQETYSYDAWGNALTATGNVGMKNKFRFTGEALDPATGLYFLRARYYDHTAGRLLSKDPLAGFSHFPVMLNRYTYAANNPLKFVDPSGKQALLGPLWVPEEQIPFDAFDPWENEYRTGGGNNVSLGPPQGNFSASQPYQRVADFGSEAAEFIDTYPITPQSQSQSSNSCGGAPPPSSFAVPTLLPTSPSDILCAMGSCIRSGPPSPYVDQVLQRCIGSVCFPF
jgi:RHS repeat-associated protein